MASDYQYHLDKRAGLKYPRVRSVFPLLQLSIAETSINNKVYDHTVPQGSAKITEVKSINIHLSL